MLMFLLLQIPELRRNEEARRPVWGSGLLGGSGLLTREVELLRCQLPFIQRSLHPPNAGNPEQPADRWLVDPCWVGAAAR